jgi:hypothetical protein
MSPLTIINHKGLENLSVPPLWLSISYPDSKDADFADDACRTGPQPHAKTAILRKRSAYSSVFLRLSVFAA